MSDLFAFGPTRTYIGRREGDARAVEVRHSNGHVETLEPLPDSRYGVELTWDYSGSGSQATAGAILSHALGEPTDTFDYSERIRPLLMSFVTAFLGDAQHENVIDGFELPGEIVLLWVVKNEARILAQRETAPVARSSRDVTRDITKNRDEYRKRVMQGAPRTLEQLLDAGPG